MAVDEYDALILASTRSYGGVLGRPSARASRLEAVIEACSGGARQSVVVANQGSSARRTRGPVMGIAEGVETLGHCSPRRVAAGRDQPVLGRRRRTRPG